MTALLLLFCMNGAACLLLTPVCRRIALRLGLVDRPDGRRKVHRSPIPLAGGVALLASTTLTLGVVTLFADSLLPADWVKQLAEQRSMLIGLLLSSMVICGVGILDDRVTLRGRQKLLGQLVAIAILIGFGVKVEQIRFFHEWTFVLGPLSVPFTAFLLLGAVNSLNLLDGMDGLLGFVGLIIALALGTMGFLQSEEKAPTAIVAIALAGGLLGFLRYNFPPATVFLGDAGSMLIGLVIGTLAIQSSLKGPATAALAAPLATLTIPILDTIAAILRRKLTGRSIYATDRGHLHHCLLGHGFSNRGVLVVVSTLCLVSVVGAVISLVIHAESIAILTAVTVAGILVGIRLFGYAEFVLAKDSLIATATSLFHRGTDGKPHAVAVHLQGTARWRDLWDQFVAAAEELNLKTIRLDVNAPAIQEGYHALWNHDSGPADPAKHVWYADIPLIVGGQAVGHVEITGRQDDVPVWRKIAALSDLLADVDGTVSALVERSRGPAPAPSFVRVAPVSVESPPTLYDGPYTPLVSEPVVEKRLVGHS